MTVKTTYLNGSYLTPAAINGYFGVDAATGHEHSGVNDATSAPKIDLTGAKNVTGLLPVSNIAFTDGTFIANFTQFITTVNSTCSYRLIPSTIGGMPSTVMINFPAISATSNGTAFTDSSGHVPAALRPTGFALQPCVVRNASKYQSGMVRINSTGDIIFSVFEVDGSACNESLNFVASGTKGFYEFTMTYPKY